MAKYTLQTLLGNMAQLVYPKLCEGCSRTLVAQEQILCLDCIIQLPFTQYHHISKNDSEQRFAGRILFEKATALAYFTEDALFQHLLHEFKYKSNFEIGNFLAQQMAFVLKKSDWAKGVDFIVPVPLFPKKEKTRGFNQCIYLAQKISEALGIGVDSQTLIRMRDTDTQTHKSRAERADNMSGAFGITDVEKLKNKRVVILDDVLTTGATIEACVQALQKIEGIKINIATIGIAI